MPPTQATQRRKLYEDVAAQLEARITTGEYPDGGQLPSERELMQQFGVSRTSVREALFALQKMGLVSVGNGARARITKPNLEVLLAQLSGAVRSLVADREGISQLQEARTLFECGLARHAARHATPRQMERISLALSKNKDSMGDSAAFARTDMDYHLAIAAIPNNAIFTSLHGALAEWLFDQRVTGLTVRGAARDAFRAHESIYAAIVSRDPDQAEQAMASHLAQVSGYFWQAERGRL